MYYINLTKFGKPLTHLSIHKLYDSSHLMGTFYRTIRMVENGIKPVFVFDGKPPDMKSGEVWQLLGDVLKMVP